MVERIPCSVPIPTTNALRKALEEDGWFCSAFSENGRLLRTGQNVCVRGDRVIAWRTRR